MELLGPAAYSAPRSAEDAGIGSVCAKNNNNIININNNNNNNNNNKPDTVST